MTTDERVALMESRHRISELRYRYAWAAARGDAMAVARMFTEDCIFEGPFAPGQRATITSRRELEAFLAGPVGIPGAIIPLIHNEITKIEGDVAWGASVFESPSVPRFGHMIAQYIEGFRKVDGAWRFSERRMYLMKPYWEEQPDCPWM